MVDTVIGNGKIHLGADARERASSEEILLAAIEKVSNPIAKRMTTKTRIENFEIDNEKRVG